MALAFAAAALTAPAEAAVSDCEGVAGNLVTNCGFENRNGLNLPGWTLGGEQTVFSLAFGQHSGDRFGLMKADSGNFVTMSQTVGGPGTYDVSFWLAYYSFGLLLPQEFSISLGDQTLTSVNRPIVTPQNWVWEPFTFNGVTTSSQATLLFTYNNLFVPNVQTADLLIDDIVITGGPTAGAVPKPASLARLGLGFAAIAATRRRRVR